MTRLFQEFSMLSRRLMTTTALTAASLLLAAGPAFAQSGGGAQPAPADAPAPAPALSLCPEYADGGTYQADGSLLFANDFPGQICMIVRWTPTGVLSLLEIRLAPDWTATTKSAGGGSSNRIDVTWSNQATGEEHSIVEQPGKTVIR
jgi:hypothetical protein